MQTPQRLDHDADAGSFDMWLDHANMEARAAACYRRTALFVRLLINAREMSVEIKIEADLNCFRENDSRELPQLFK